MDRSHNDHNGQKPNDRQNGCRRRNDIKNRSYNDRQNDAEAIMT